MKNNLGHLLSLLKQHLLNIELYKFDGFLLQFQDYWMKQPKDLFKNNYKIICKYHKKKKKKKIKKLFLNIKKKKKKSIYIHIYIYLKWLINKIFNIYILRI